MIFSKEYIESRVENTLSQIRVFLDLEEETLNLIKEKKGIH